MILNFEKDHRSKVYLRSFFNTIDAINNLYERVHGERFNFRQNQGKTANVTLNGKNYEIRLNETVPNAELFSLAMELVRPAVEAYSSREILESDTSFHEGSQTVGFDVLEQSGEATLVAAGRTADKINQTSVAISRELNAVAKIMAQFQVTRDDLQLYALRNDRGMGPLVDLMEEKIQNARDTLAWKDDIINWIGGSIEGVTAGRIPGLMSYVSTNSAEYDKAKPTAGKQEAVATVDTRTKWSDKTSDEIVADIQKGAQWVRRSGVYIPRVLAIPHESFTELSFRKVSDVDSTPLIEWIKRTMSATYNIEFKIVGTSALSNQTSTGTKRTNTAISSDAFMILDNNRRNFVVADVEKVIMNTAEQNAQDTITQVIQQKTGGVMGKHPSAIYVGTGI